MLKLPKEERVCLLQLGHMANQVLMFEKLLIFATKLDPKNEVEQYTTGVQTQMLVRLAVSAVFESLLVVERLFVTEQDRQRLQGQARQKGQRFPHLSEEAHGQVGTSSRRPKQLRLPLP